MNYLILFRNRLLMYVNMVYLTLVSGKLIFVLAFFYLCETYYLNLEMNLL